MNDKEKDLEMQCACEHEHPETVREVRAAMPDENVTADLSDFFKVFGDSSRMRILFALDRRELCVCDLSAALGMTKSAVSHQLRFLRTNHLVASRHHRDRGRASVGGGLSEPLRVSRDMRDRRSARYATAFAVARYVCRQAANAICRVRGVSFPYVIK